MSRLEENKILINEMSRRANDMPDGLYEEIMGFNIGAIASMLADISKSLAIIADKVESEVNNES